MAMLYIYSTPIITLLIMNVCRSTHLIPMVKGVGNRVVYGVLGFVLVDSVQRRRSRRAVLCASRWSTHTQVPFHAKEVLFKHSRNTGSDRDFFFSVLVLLSSDSFLFANEYVKKTIAFLNKGIEVFLPLYAVSQP